jgi:DnaJ-domain-containing protein 1
MMQGVILDGSFKGQELSDLDFTQLIALWKECQTDAQSVAVLEAYLDRSPYQDWRERIRSDEQSNNDQSRPGYGNTMTTQEAYAILGLQPDATEDDIKKAHKRLMQKFHPDHGGSDYLAARINQAKELLLRG